MKAISQSTAAGITILTRDHSTLPALFVENAIIDLNEDDELTFNEKKQQIDQKQIQQIFHFNIQLSFVAKRALHSRSHSHLNQPLYLLKSVFLI